MVGGIVELDDGLIKDVVVLPLEEDGPQLDWSTQPSTGEWALTCHAHMLDCSRWKGGNL